VTNRVANNRIGFIEFATNINFRSRRNVANNARINDCVTAVFDRMQRMQQMNDQPRFVLVADARRGGKRKERKEKKEKEKRTDSQAGND